MGNLETNKSNTETEKTLRKLLSDTRKKYMQANKKEQELRDFINFVLPNVELEDIPTSAENSSNLNDAISGFVLYGEYGIDEIINEFKTLSEII